MKKADVKNTSLSNSLATQSKDKDKKTQLKTIFEYLQKNIATASMVEAATGVKQKNICRYKKDLEKSGRLWELYKDNCKLTGFKSWFLTTDPDKVPNFNKQLNLF